MEDVGQEKERTDRFRSERFDALERANPVQG